MAKKYYSMNDVPIGTKMIVKSTEEEVVLLEIQNFPTTFITENTDKVKKNYMTYEVEIIDWPPEGEL
jgi:hypothetical protein